MQNLENKAILLENMASVFFRMLKDGKLSTNELAAITEPLKRSVAQLNKVIKEFEGNIKEQLEYTESITYGNKKYFLKRVDSKVFDTKKAQDKLKELGYHLGDFTKIQPRKSIDYELIT